jgi:hypothetical protein
MRIHRPQIKNEYSSCKPKWPACFSEKALPTYLYYNTSLSCSGRPFWNHNLCSPYPILSQILRVPLLTHQPHPCKSLESDSKETLLTYRIPFEITVEPVIAKIPILDQKLWPKKKKSLLDCFHFWKKKNEYFFP